MNKAIRWSSIKKPAIFLVVAKRWLGCHTGFDYDRIVLASFNLFLNRVQVSLSLSLSLSLVRITGTTLHGYDEIKTPPRLIGFQFENN